jgi:transcriptional regulator with XRE-family HTH domain
MSAVNDSTPSLSQHVAAEVRAEMARQQKRQGELAEIIGVTQPAVSRYLSGERPMTIDVLQKIADFLGVPLSHFITVAA